MTEAVQQLSEKLDEVLKRIQHLEEWFAKHEGGTPPNGATEPAARWQFLIARPHPWRRQLCIKGRNMTVGQMMSTIRANRLTPEQASEDLDLPIGAIYEALAYYAENRGLIELEAAEERRHLAERGYPLTPEERKQPKR